MDLIKIENVNNCDVVDSRLIAQELGIQHKNLVETIRKYQDRLEKRGQLAFKTYDVKMPNGGTSSRLEHYWLNERHCIFLTTLSRNTEQVVDLKDKIEESFYQAKQVNKSNSNISSDHLELLTQFSSQLAENQKIIKKSLESISILEEEKFEREYYLEKLNEITKEHPLFKSLIELKMLIKLNSYNFPSISYSIRDLSLMFMTSKITPRDLAFYSSHLYFLDYSEKPLKKEGHYVYYGKDLIYPLLVLFRLEGFSWEDLRNALEIDYLIKFPSSNRGYLPK